MALRKQSTQQQRGLTLLELLIVIAIVGIMALMAAPNYSRMVEKSKLREAMHEWQNSFHLAQSEAMRMQRRVRMCISSDGVNCDTTTTGNFNAGWIVIVPNPTNPNTGSLLRDSLPVSKTNMFLQSYQDGTGAGSPQAVSSINFLGTGRIQIDSLGRGRSLALAVNTSANNSALSPNDGLCLIISSEGRMRLPIKNASSDERNHCKKL